MSRFNDQVNFWAHMLDESDGRDYFLNESLEDSVSAKTNIVCIQCLFRNLLTKNLLNVQTDAVNTSNRKGLDFEIYYQVDGTVMKQLLDAKLLVSNIKDPTPLANSTQIVDILASHQPVAAFLTDSYGDRITDNVLSPMSEKILRQFNAQQPNVSVFRFSYFNADYDVFWRKLYALAGNNDILKPDTVTSIWKKTGVASLKVGGKVVPKGKFVELPVYLISGYWNKILWDPEHNQFEVGKDSSVGSIIPAIKARVKGRESTALWEATKTIDQIDNGKLVDFIESAMKTAEQSGRDLRNSQAAQHNEAEAPMNEDGTYGNDDIADSICMLIDNNLQKLLTFGDEFYGVEVLDDLTLKFVIGGDATVDAHHAENNDFDDYSVLRVDSDAKSNLLEKLCESINVLLIEHGIKVNYFISKDSLDLASRSVHDSAHQEYMSTGRTNVRYACDVVMKVKR